MQCKNVLIILSVYKKHAAEIADELLHFFALRNIYAAIYEYDGASGGQVKTELLSLQTEDIVPNNISDGV